MLEIAQRSMQAILGRLAERLSDVFSFPLLVAPGDRLYGIYLITFFAGAVGLFVLGRAGYRATEKEFSGKGLLAYIFPKSVYRHRSAILEYKFYVVNRIVMKLILFTTLAASFVIFGALVKDLLTAVFGVNDNLFVTDATASVLYAVLLFLAFDFGFYVAHYLDHKIKFLWEFHKVHHSAVVMTPITNYRFHPLDLLTIVFSEGVSMGIVTGAFGYFFAGGLNHPSILLTWLPGLSVFMFVFFLYSNFRHSHYWLSWGWKMNHLLVSPAQHQIHHSNEARHIDRNFGMVLGIWDWMFGTIYVPRGRETFTLGLQDGEHEEYSTIWGLYSLPFRKIARGLRRRREKTA